MKTGAEFEEKSGEISRVADASKGGGNSMIQLVFTSRSCLLPTTPTVVALKSFEMSCEGVFIDFFQALLQSAVAL